MALTQTLVAQLGEVCAGYNWKAALDGGPTSWIKAASAMTGYLRAPATPGNHDLTEGQESLTDRFRKLSAQLSRAWAIASGSQTLDELRPEVRFYGEVRVYMGKFDASERQARGEPVPAEIQRLLSRLVADSTQSGEIVDIYQAAGMPKPSLADLGPDFVARATAATNPPLAIEALRATLTEESGKVSRHNLVQQRAFSQRLAELINKYTNPAADLSRSDCRAHRDGPGRGESGQAGGDVRPCTG